MKAQAREGHTPFTGHRVTLEWLIPKGWSSHQEFIADKASELLAEIEKKYPEMVLVMQRDYLEGVDLGGICYQEYELVLEAQAQDDFLIDEEALDEAIWEEGFKQSAKEHYVQHLNEVCKEAEEEANKVPMVK